jgi:hypothetical protein
MTMPDYTKVLTEGARVELIGGLYHGFKCTIEKLRLPAKAIVRCDTGPLLKYKLEHMRVLGDPVEEQTRHESFNMYVMRQAVRNIEKSNEALLCRVQDLEKRALEAKALQPPAATDHLTAYERGIVDAALSDIVSLRLSDEQFSAVKSTLKSAVVSARR